MTDPDPSSSNGPAHKTRGVMSLFKIFRKGHGDAEAQAQEHETPATGELVSHAREFQDLRVDDVMTPRADIVGIAQSSTFAEVVAPMRRAKVWEFGLQYVVVFGAYVALSAVLPVHA